MLKCNCGRCHYETNGAYWTDREHVDSDAELNFCPECGQPLNPKPFMPLAQLLRPTIRADRRHH